MRQFVRDEIFPLETLDLSYDAMLEAVMPLQEEVKDRGLWAAHLPPELGGGGLRPGQAGPDARDPGPVPLGPVVFGNNAPDSGNAELLAIGIESSGREEHRGRWLAAPARRDGCAAASP